MTTKTPTLATLTAERDAHHAAADEAAGKLATLAPGHADRQALRLKRDANTATAMDLADPIREAAAQRFAAIPTELAATLGGWDREYTAVIRALEAGDGNLTLAQRANDLYWHRTLLASELARIEGNLLPGGPRWPQRTEAVPEVLRPSLTQRVELPPDVLTRLDEYQVLGRLYSWATSGAVS